MKGVGDHQMKFILDKFESFCNVASSLWIHELLCSRWAQSSSSALVSFWKVTQTIDGSTFSLDKARMRTQTQKVYTSFWQDCKWALGISKTFSGRRTRYYKKRPMSVKFRHVLWIISRKQFKQHQHAGLSIHDLARYSSKSSVSLLLPLVVLIIIFATDSTDEALALSYHSHVLKVRECVTNCCTSLRWFIKTIAVEW